LNKLNISRLNRSSVVILLILIILSVSLVSAVVTLTFNSPDDNSISTDTFRLLNVSVNTNTSGSLRVYGSSSPSVSNSSLIYTSEISGDSDYTYNWTSPKLTTDSDVLLLMYFDNQSFEHVDEIVSDSSTVSLMHFNNDSAFNENTSFAYDFSGNANHAVIYDSSYSEGRLYDSLLLNSSGYADLGNSSDFNITDNLTVEGWFNVLGSLDSFGDISESMDSYAIDTNISISTTSPRPFRISEDLYAVVYKGNDSDGFISTLQIYPNGSIGNSLDILEFDTSSGNTPVINKVSENVYAITYNGPSGDGFISTVTISDDGSISDSIIDTFEFDTSNGGYPDVTHISGNIYGVVYTGNNGDGYITTLEILSNGSISQSNVDTYEFETDDCDYPIFQKLSENIFAIAYNGPDSDGFIKTVEILDNGSITNSVISTFEFDTSSASYPYFIKIYNNIYAIAYTGTGSDGFISTVEILDNGSIIDSVIDSYEFDTSEAQNPSIVHVSGDLYTLAYNGQANDGFVTTLRISKDGDISSSVLDIYEFDESAGDYPRIINVKDNIYAIFYQGPGTVSGVNLIAKTINIASGNIAALGDSFSIFTDGNDLFASVEHNTISSSISSGWNHFALTYDNSESLENQKLYINGILSANSTYYDNISFESDSLLIGKDFDGYIDEIIIKNSSISENTVRFHAGILLLDETGNNNGTKDFESDVFNYDGKLGPALELDSSGYATVDDSSNLDLTSDFSISFWIYPTNLSSDQTFISKGSGTTTNYYVGFVNSTNKISFGYYNGAWRSLSVDALEILESAWSQITVTRNSSSNFSTVYINGENKGDLKTDYVLPANDYELKIGYFPGFGQYYTGLIDELIIYNKTLTETEVTNFYELDDDVWYWKFSAEDFEEYELSSTNNFEVGSVWSVSPVSLGSTGTALNTNVSLGTVTVTNSHSVRNITLNISHDYAGVLEFNDTFPLNISAGSYKNIMINITSPVTEGSTSINLYLNATDADTSEDSFPSSLTVPASVVTTQSQPYIITNFETYPSIVSQNNSGVTLIASATNKGQGHAGMVSLTFELPSGWTNTSGALTQSLGILLVDEQKNATLTLDIESDASSGLKTLYANLTAQNSTGSYIDDSYKTVGFAEVFVNSVQSGITPTITTTSTVTGNTGRNGGGGGSGGGTVTQGYNFQRDMTERGTELLVTNEEIEIVRGEENSFNVRVKNIFRNTVMDNVKLKIEGYLSKYLEITPVSLDDIIYNEYKEFKVNIKSPEYLEENEYALEMIITGDISGVSVEKELLEKRQIKLIIQAISEEEAKTLLENADSEVKRLSAIINDVHILYELLDTANTAFDERNFGKVKDICETILSLKDKGIEAEDIIKSLSLNMQSTEIGASNAITGAFLGISFNFKNTKDLLNLARAALERGDYETALKRAKEAQMAFELESGTKFSPVYYLFKNWYWALLIFVLVGVTGFYGYKVQASASISQKIVNLSKEEENIKSLMKESQKKYYTTTSMSNEEFLRLTAQYRKRLADIRRSRIELRNKRMRLLKPKQVIRDIDKELDEYLDKVKTLQKDYYEKHKMSRDDYNTMLKSYSIAIAEAEDERFTVETEIASKDKNILLDEHELDMHNSEEHNLKENSKSEIDNLNKSDTQNIQSVGNLNDSNSTKSNSTKSNSNKSNLNKSNLIDSNLNDSNSNNDSLSKSKENNSKFSSKKAKRMTPEELKKFFPITSSEVNKKNK